ncbi:uncharacterized protein LOC111060599 isoform X2 [Nilaparvata lugens]|uniref:uncharacterized protein LOC111060599 isoform X2 n=1 Tax=Nilaparvata lugens TaxID=108931 RepID=UPI00193DAD77|nr:uncharacterized protein LOC111060599 isoform X2 [Nilaparvata lugens]
MMCYWYHLLIILEVCVLMIWGDKVLSTEDCSVLPNSEPKCFTPTFDLRNKPMTALKDRQGPKQTIKINTGYGVNIALGQDPRYVFGNQYQTVICVKQSNANYEKRFQPDLYKRKDNDLYGDLERILLTELFIVTRREVWECKREGETKLDFYRIVTEILSNSALGTVEFRYGFEYITLSIPYLLSNNSIQYKITAAREIKYIDTAYRVVKYDGVLKFIKPRDEDSDERDPVHMIQVKDFTELSTFESDWRKREDKEHPDQGITYSEESTTLKCRLKEGSRFRSTRYLPRWSYRKEGEEPIGKTYISPSDFLNYFIVTKHDVWKCVLREFQPQITFYRAVIEYVGKTAIDDIDVYQDGKTIYRYLLSDTSMSIGIRQIMYFKEDDPDKSLRYYGGINLIIPEGFPEKVATEKLKPKKILANEVLAKISAAAKARREEAEEIKKLEQKKKPRKKFLGIF